MSDINTLYSLIFDNSLSIDEENKFIKYLNFGTMVGELLDNIYVVNGNVTIYDKNNNEVNDDGMVVTGYKLVVYNGTTKKDEYTLSVLGDANGDELVNSLDLVILRKHIVEYKNIYTGVVEVQIGVYKLALDISKDDTISSLDVVKIRKKIVGLE